MTDSTDDAEYGFIQEQCYLEDLARKKRQEKLRQSARGAELRIVRLERRVTELERLINEYCFLK